MAVVDRIAEGRWGSGRVYPFAEGPIGKRLSAEERVIEALVPALLQARVMMDDAHGGGHVWQMACDQFGKWSNVDERRAACALMDGNLLRMR